MKTSLSRATSTIPASTRTPVRITSAGKMLLRQKGSITRGLRPRSAILPGKLQDRAAVNS